MRLDARNAPEKSGPVSGRSDVAGAILAASLPPWALLADVSNPDRRPRAWLSPKAAPWMIPREITGSCTVRSSRRGLSCVWTPAAPSKGLYPPPVNLTSPARSWPASLPACMAPGKHSARLSMSDKPGAICGQRPAPTHIHLTAIVRRPSRAGSRRAAGGRCAGSGAGDGAGSVFGIRKLHFSGDPFVPTQYGFSRQLQNGVRSADLLKCVQSISLVCASSASSNGLFIRIAPPAAPPGPAPSSRFRHMERIRNDSSVSWFVPIFG